MLLGNWNRTIDPKNRIVVPADLRAHFADGGYLSNQGNYVGVFPSLEFHDFVGKIRRDVDLGIQSRRLLQVVASGSFSFSLDSAGRLLLPAQFRTRFSADGDVLMVGSDTHLGLYRPEDWAVASDEVGDLGPLLDHYV